MKSIALNDSTIVPHDDDDYVLVQPTTVEGQEMRLDDDEESYDHCDDVYSLHSAPQSFAIDSQALQRYQDDFFATEGQSRLSESTQDIQILLQGISTMVSSSNDQKNSEYQSDGNNCERLPELSSVSERSLEERLSPLDPAAFVVSDADSVGSLSPPDCQEHDSASIADRVPGEVALACPASSKQRTEQRDVEDTHSAHQQESSFSMAKQATKHQEDRQDAPPKHKTSRLSNKKRRKQLKLAKRAAAAAAAAAALSTTNLPTRTHTPSPARTKQAIRLMAQQTKTKPKTKRPANNIAVACATDTMARYRTECLQHSPARKGR